MTEPQFLLSRRLRTQHVNAIRDLRTATTRFAEEWGFDWVVHDIQHGVS